MKRAEIISTLRKNNLTDFQIDVLLATMKIPKGEVATYKEVARMAGHPNAYRAAGTALRKNPLAPMIPCHRVIKSDGSLGNYSSGGTKRKKAILQKENAID